MDHYGRNYVGDDAQWPRVGVRIPHESMTLAEFRQTKGRKRGPENGEGGDESPNSSPKRALHGWRSLAAALITQPQQPWKSTRDYTNFDD